MITKILLYVLTISVHVVFSQTKIHVPRYLKMPKDSIIKSNIISDLNAFLQASQNKNDANSFVLPSQKVETFILLDEFKNIEKSQGHHHFFKPYLNNIVQLSKQKWLIQLSHIGINDGVPYLRTLYNIIAHQKDSHFLFSSPLTEHTKGWQIKQLNNVIFYYKEHLNMKNVNKYVSLSKIFDEKLQSKHKTTTIYCAKNKTTLLQLIGIDYKLDYNGQTTGSFSALNDDNQLIISGYGESFNDFDPHDLWHDRLSLVISRRKVNKPVDEGCAYLYGGSWGLTWKTIFNLFLEKVAANKDSDWMYYKEHKTNFAENQAEHLMVDYVINALLIKKIEHEKGFAGVWKLLNCGVFEKGNDNYYNSLNEIIGISKKNYNKTIWKLIQQEKK